MIRFLMLVYFILAVLGAVYGHLFVTIISVFMIVFTKYGERQLDKRDAEFFASPAGAAMIAVTMQKLAMQECECTADSM